MSESQMGTCLFPKAEYDLGLKCIEIWNIACNFLMLRLKVRRIFSFVAYLANPFGQGCC